MKTMSKRAWVLYVFIAAFLAGLIVLFYTFYTNADSWAMKKANRHLYSSGTLSVAGSIKDETGAVLAETKDGKRVYNSDKTVRTATMHTVGDSEGYIATGIHLIAEPQLLCRGHKLIGSELYRNLRKCAVTGHIESLFEIHGSVNPEALNRAAADLVFARAFEFLRIDIRQIFNGTNRGYHFKCRAGSINAGEKPV